MSKLPLAEKIASDYQVTLAMAVLMLVEDMNNLRALDWVRLTPQDRQLQLEGVLTHLSQLPSQPQ